MSDCRFWSPDTQIPSALILSLSRKPLKIQVKMMGRVLKKKLERNDTLSLLYSSKPKNFGKPRFISSFTSLIILLSNEFIWIYWIWSEIGCNAVRSGHFSDDVFFSILQIFDFPIDDFEATTWMSGQSDTPGKMNRGAIRLFYWLLVTRVTH